MPLSGLTTLAGRRLGGEKARRGEQERGAEGLEGGVEGGGASRRVGGAETKSCQSARRHPQLRDPGHWGRVWRPPCLLRLPNGPLSQVPPPCGHLAAGGHYRMLLFSVRRSRRRQEPLAGAVPGSAHYPTAWQGGMPREWWKLARSCAQGMPTWPELGCSDEASALYWWGSPDTCLRPGKT